MQQLPLVKNRHMESNRSDNCEAAHMRNRARRHEDVWREEVQLHYSSPRHWMEVSAGTERQEQNGQF